MFFSIAKIVVAACMISFTSWLSAKKPGLAGFLVALPLNTLLALLFSYTQYKDTTVAVKFAQSIFAAVPLSLMFFVPFLLAHRIGFGFWGLYALGIGFLIIAYFAHRYLVG